MITLSTAADAQSIAINRVVMQLSMVQNRVYASSRGGNAPAVQRVRRTGGASRVRVVRTSASVEKYDYIIVGGGTAGCVLANRLSAQENKKVLVLEAGGPGGPLYTRVPAGLARLFRHPFLDWGLNTLSQKQLNGREIYLARGKLLGGSSSTNATLYHRGSAADYDGWGLDGWSSRDVLDWFVKAENNTESRFANSKYHGTGGVMNVESPRYENPLHEEFFRAAQAAGIKENNDFNDWSRPQAGYGEFQVTQKRGERADMYRQYLEPIMGRPNLKVVPQARTTKLHIDKGTTRGVEYVTGAGGGVELGPKNTAELAPGGEVLLCAGAIHSPHILQLSGIGPAAMLSEHGIPLVADLPAVGANLQDHPAVVYAARTKEEFDDLAITSQIYNKSNNIRKRSILKYLFLGRGPLTSTGCEHGAFVSTTGSGEADLQIRFVPGFALDPDGVGSYIRFGELKKAGQTWPCGITMQMIGVRAKSKGTVGLKSSDPLVNPAINLSYLTDPEGADMATMKAALKLGREIASQEPLAKYVTNEVYPGPERTDDASLVDFIRKTVHSGNAVVGTCRMGPSAESGAVVSSSELSVFGVEGLRVVDASVVPIIPGGQTAAVTVMVAERAAAMLLAKDGAAKRVGAPTPQQPLVPATA